MKNDGKSQKKIDLILFLAEKLFHPQIIYEDKALQDRNLNEPCVIICNHSRKKMMNILTSGDGPIIRWVFNNRNVCSLMAEDLMENPIMKSAVSGLDCIPVCRTSASTDWIHKCKEKLAEGTSVIIFPEGTTLKEKDIIDFKPGFALLSSLANVKVLPMAINGVYIPFTKGKLKIKIGVPEKIPCERMTPTELKKTTAYFQDKIEDMYYSFTDNSDTIYDNEKQTV